MPASKNCRILSLDGGGIRGLITAILLERLEEKLTNKFPGTRLKDHFDIIAGTSAGSLIACGVAKGLSTAEIKKFYLDQGKEIFPPSHPLWNVIRNLLRTGYTSPLYDGRGLEKVLKGIFKEDSFDSLEKATIITTYDAYNRQALVLKNTEPEMGEIQIWEVCRASAAAPVAFPAHVIARGNKSNEKFLNYLTTKGNIIPSDGLPLMDGGVVANNPALCAIAERLKWNDQPPEDKWLSPEQRPVNPANILVAAFGTGQSVKNITVQEATVWGAGEWANPLNGIPLIDVLFDGSADAVDYIAEQVLPNSDNYYRFQPLLDKSSSGSAFDAKPDYLKDLENVARKFLESDGRKQENRLDTLINKLYL